MCASGAVESSYHPIRMMHCQHTMLLLRDVTSRRAALPSHEPARHFESRGKGMLSVLRIL